VKKEELERKVEEVKQDADVQRALKQATPAEAAEGPVARTRDKLYIGTHLLLLIALAAAYQLLNSRFPGFIQRYPTVLKLILALAVVVIGLMVIRLLDVYFVARVKNAVYQYNLKQVARLIIWLAGALFVLTIFFQNWYTAVVSFGLISLILGFALQTPITSFIGWVYILVREPYRVGDRIKIGRVTGDVIDVTYLDTTLWEFGGDYLSTEHPSGGIIKFPNSNVLNTPVYNYTWPLFPYIWNEVKLHVAYDADLEFIAATMKKVAEEEVGEAMMKQVEVFRHLLAQTPVNQVEVQERPVVIFRLSESGSLEAILRYLVHPKEAGKVKSRMIRELLAELNANPDRAMFPKSK
jgi:small-conductance mechanosensitive channel